MPIFLENYLVGINIRARLTITIRETGNINKRSQYHYCLTFVSVPLYNFDTMDHCSTLVKLII